MKISAILELTTVQILLFIGSKGEVREVRYAELSSLVRSRGTLSLSLRELDEEGLIQRRIVSSKPIQSYYSLTAKGRIIAERFSKMKNEIH